MAATTMQVELVVPRPRVGPLVRRAVLFPAWLAVAELVARFADATAGAALFALMFLVLVNAAAVRAARTSDASGLVVRMLLVASLVPLARLLVLSSPLVPWLRLDPHGLWGLPLALAAGLALRQLVARGHHLPLLPAGVGAGTLLRLVAVGLSGLPLGLVAYYVGTALPGDEVFRIRAFTWVGLVLLVVAGVAEEVVVRGVVLPLALDALGQHGRTLVVVLSSYLWAAWLGWATLGPVLVASVLFTSSAERHRCLYGGLLGRVLLLVSLVTVWPAVLA
jgi:hypothetical protein